ncbi:glycosyltransferase family 2 protein [Myxococcota bacterium]|nr:glycosyltransferase family 2 protein [Myxococcota bacterium]
MKLLIVIVNYRITDLTLDCLRTLEKPSHRVPDCKVVVVENGTGEADAKRIQQLIDERGYHDWCELMAIDPNRGFTGGNNVAIRPALHAPSPPEYVLLLNADTLVPEGQIQILVDFMDNHPAAGIAGTRLQFPDGEVQGTPFNFMTVAAELDRGLQSKAFYKVMRPWAIAVDPKPTAATKVDWVAGASMIVRRSVFEAIGLLDEAYFTYFDDIDFCLSAAKAGFETWYVPESHIVHLEGKSTGIVNTQESKRASYWFEARRRFLLKQHGPAKAALADVAFIAGLAVRKAASKVTGKPVSGPPNMFEDSIKHSVFAKGFELNVVENPSMKKKS